MPSCCKRKASRQCQHNDDLGALSTYQRSFRRCVRWGFSDQTHNPRSQAGSVQSKPPPDNHPENRVRPPIRQAKSRARRSSRHDGVCAVGVLTVVRADQRARRATACPLERAASLSNTPRNVPSSVS